METYWKSRQYQPERVKDILVLSIAGIDDSSAAISMEREVVKSLRTCNYSAESAIEHFGTNAFSKIREEDIIKQL